MPRSKEQLLERLADPGEAGTRMPAAAFEAVYIAIEVLIDIRDVIRAGNAIR